MWEIFKEVIRTPMGKKSLLYMALASAAALIVPKIMPNASALIMFSELAFCIIISVNVNRISQMMSMAAFYREQEEKND